MHFPAGGIGGFRAAFKAANSVSMSPAPAAASRMGRRPPFSLPCLGGLDPDRLDVQILFHLLDAGFAAVAAHPAAAERHAGSIAW